MTAELYLGLISGTSMDGIDAALVDFSCASQQLIATHAQPYPRTLRRELLALRHADLGEADIGAADAAVGNEFRDAALTLLNVAGVDRSTVHAIGSHGQTIRHEPDASPPYSLQIGMPQRIADATGITTVADFRSADIAAGGQGAPLVPPYHAWLFAEPGKDCAVVNIGGIANITRLPAEGDVTGYDTGPGNTLLDAWIARHRDLPFDDDGAWAAAGCVESGLLAKLLADSYFGLPPPKSTGFEHFNLDWLDAAGTGGIDAVDVQATLAELTAITIARALTPRGGQPGDETAGRQPPIAALYVCGGGAHNAYLLQRLQAQLPGVEIASTAIRGLDPDWVEACAFAWLARRRLRGESGNLPSVTGAREACLLGSVHEPAGMRPA